MARALLIGAGYLLAGELAGLLAIPPGYAAPIWPAAGIAVVGVLIFGTEAAAGVFVAAFLLNLHIALRHGDRPFAAGLLVALAVAVGTSAQALFAGWLTRRFLGPGNPLERGASVTILLLLTGPLACVVSASWSLLWLMVAGYVQPADAVANFLTWWVGDTIGVMLVSPLVLTWAAKVGRPRLHEWVVLLAPLALGLAGVGILFVGERRRAEVERAAAFRGRAELVADLVERDLDRAAAYVESTARAFGMLPEIDRRAFTRMVGPWLRAHAGVTAFEWAPLVPRGQLPAFEADARDAEFPDYWVRSQGPDTPAGAPPPPFHAPLLFVEPLEERAAVGYDLASSPRRLAALEAARDTGAVVSTGGVRLILHRAEWGTLLVAAAYGGMEPPATLADRRATLRGFVAAAVQFEPLLSSAVARAGDAPVVVRVYDLSEEGPRLLAGPQLAANEVDALTWSKLHLLGGRQLRLEVVQAGPLPHPWVGWSVLAAGLAGTALFIAFVLDLRGQALRVERLVEARTSALAQSNEALTRSNLELQRFAYVASHDLREPLRTITAFGELLERDAERLDPELRRHLGRITRATRRMQALVTELLAFARVERSVEPFTTVGLEHPVRAALDDLAGVIEQAGARVRVGPLPTAWCDRVQMVQLFTNLLSNALKFRRPGVTVEIEVEGGVAGAGCEVRVHDNGIGIAPRDHERIFEFFQRLHPDDAYPGRGVGLATCRRIVERHGGRIWVESALGRGSVFHVSLPCAVPP